MGSELPDLSESELCRQLAESVDEPISESLASALYRHYVELRRWNPRVSLIGPGTADEIVRRHYGESLAARSLVGPRDRKLLDVGSGGGFPGLVLAAACPFLEVTLTEPRQRKWAFLKTAVRRLGLSCRCLDARVTSPLPVEIGQDFDLVTCRAMVMPPELFQLLHRCSPRARFLSWFGKGRPDLPEGLAVRREVPLAGSRSRRILEICPAET